MIYSLNRFIYFGWHIFHYAYLVLKWSLEKFTVVDSINWGALLFSWSLLLYLQFYYFLYSLVSIIYLIFHLLTHCPNDVLWCVWYKYLGRFFLSLEHYSYPFLWAAQMTDGLTFHHPTPSSIEFYVSKLVLSIDNSFLLLVWLLSFFFSVYASLCKTGDINNYNQRSVNFRDFRPVTLKKSSLNVTTGSGVSILYDHYYEILLGCLFSE